ncbi:MAG: hemolysin family protein [Bacteroidaceae bacterium]|jgi:putative hemolysin
MELLIIIFLLLCNGLFAMYEMALASSRKVRLETAKKNGSKAADKVLQQLEEPEKILSAIQIGITLIGIISGAYGGMTLSKYIEPIFCQFEPLRPYADEISVTLIVALITYLSLIIGELVPKSIALSNPERYSMLFASAMSLFTRLLYPFVLFLSFSTKMLNHLFGIDTHQKATMTHDELRLLLHQSGEEGVIDKDESEMLKDVFRFSDKRASELMTHRKEVICVDLKASRGDVLALIQTAHFSKYPLIDGSFDRILGVISVKDLLPLFAAEQRHNFDLHAIADEPIFVPDCIHAKRVLELFKEKKKKFGIVVNEYGDMEGIITLHDLVESVMGNIPEENEYEEPDIVTRSDGSLLVEGSMSVSDFMEEMKIFNYDDIKDKDFSTLGGLAMYEIGRVPTSGDTFTYHNLLFEIVDMDNGRVDKLLVRKLEEETTEEEEEV